MYAAMLRSDVDATKGELMRRILLVGLFVLVCSSIAPFTFAGPSAVRCGKLLDVRSGKMLTNQLVTFDAHGIITAVGPAASASQAAGSSTIDLSDATCLPGLIDVHTHLTGDPSGSGYQALGISLPRQAINV